MKFINAENAILCILMLRGPQTIGEIKSRTDRLYTFTSMEEVNNTISDLENDHHIKRLSRRPGQKECRYIHLFSQVLEGNENESGKTTTELETRQNQEMMVIKEEMANLRQDLEALKKELNDFKNQFT